MIEHVVVILNELLAADPVATNHLFRLSVAVNDGVCRHPAIQVGGSNDRDGTLGVLGLINGLFRDSDVVGRLGNRVVIMVLDEATSNIVEFLPGWLKNGAVHRENPQ